MVRYPSANRWTRVFGDGVSGFGKIRTIFGLIGYVMRSPMIPGSYVCGVSRGKIAGLASIPGRE